MEQIKQPEIDKIYKKIYPSIKDIYNEYFFLTSSKEEFDILIAKIIIDIYNKEKSKQQNPTIRKMPSAPS